jgi:hypothetical protein
MIVILALGCEPDGGPAMSPKGSIPAAIAKSYDPVRIKIIGLTDMTETTALSLNAARLNIYVDLMDAYGSRIKSPGTFRFELYEFVPHSSEPRGDRLILWPDMNLIPAEVNNTYWQDYLRTYHFKLDLDFQPPDTRTFILEATFKTPRGKYITDKYKLTYD